eukprot:g78660.t1
MVLHSTFPMGTKILIIFVDGTHVVTKYRGKKSTGLITDHGTYPLRAIRSTGFFRNGGLYQQYRPHQHQRNKTSTRSGEGAKEAPLLTGKFFFLLQLSQASGWKVEDEEM